MMALKQGSGRLGSIGMSAPADPDSDPGSDVEFYSDLLHDATDHSDINGREEFVNLVRHLPNYDLTIPQSLVKHHLERAGCVPADDVVTRLVAVATQKFAWDILEGAVYCERNRKSNPGRDNKNGTTLTKEVLIQSMREQNVPGLEGM